MTLDDLYFITQVKKTLEFKHNGISYRLYCEDNTAGKEIIKFGQLYQEETYESFGELVNKAYVENHYLKYFIENLDKNGNII